MEETITNKVSDSGLTTLDLEKFLPENDILVFDMKDHLFMGLILKEKDFREALKSMNFEKYNGKSVALTCSADAIIPVWAYMLAVTQLQPIAKEIFFGDASQAYKNILLRNISNIALEDFRGKRVVVKGCGEKHIPEEAYVEITKLLRPLAKSIMYGEPCSTVPIFKNKS